MSVKLEDLNSDVARKLRKFDVSNNGEIDINEAVQALITLQKQSDNYKKIIWILIPIFITLIASIFGTTLLAISLTQQIKTDSSSYLLTRNGDVAQVEKATIIINNVTELAFSSDIIALDSLTTEQTYIPVTGVSQNLNIEPQEAYISTQFFTLTLYSNNSIILTPHTNFEQHPITKTYYNTILPFTPQQSKYTRPTSPGIGGTGKPGSCKVGCPGTSSKGNKIH